MYNFEEALSNPYIAVTGRVKDFLTQKDINLMPISCTMVNVEDTCYGEGEEEVNRFETIFGSLEYVGRVLKGSAGVAVNLSELRAKGDKVGKTGKSSGPLAFMPLYSQLNESVRRGGAYKSGAVVLYMDSNQPDFEAFLDLDPTDIPWAKKACYVGDELLQKPQLLNKLMQKVREGTIWLAKRSYDQAGNRLYSNVCLEILLKSRSHCTLSHVNLGQIDDLRQIQLAFRDTMTFLCELFWSFPYFSHFLSKKDDTQVGLGVVGLANLLANFKVTYEDFVLALEHVLDAEGDIPLWNATIAEQIAVALYYGFKDAGKIAKSYGMQRAFTIAPTASVSYRHQDSRGFTCTPEISPPICHPETKIPRRENEISAIEYQYPHDVEVAHHDVPWSVYYRLVKAWQELMDVDGLAHSISFNLWTEGCTFDQTFFEDWLYSPLKTTYYVMPVDQTAQDKTSIQMNVTEEDMDFWSMDDVVGEDLDSQSSCSIDAGFCSACSE